MFPVCRQRGIALHAKQAPPLPLHVLHAAEQLVVCVLCVTGRDAISAQDARRLPCPPPPPGDAHLNGAVVVVGQVRQRRPVLAQRVVAGVGIVMVVAVRQICKRPEQTHTHVSQWCAHT